jgi:hypothetical protein
MGKEISNSFLKSTKNYKNSILNEVKNQRVLTRLVLNNIARFLIISLGLGGWIGYDE